MFFIGGLLWEKITVQTLKVFLPSRGERKVISPCSSCMIQLWPLLRAKLWLERGLKRAGRAIGGILNHWISMEIDWFSVMEVCRPVHVERELMRSAACWAHSVYNEQIWRSKSFILILVASHAGELWDPPRLWHFVVWADVLSKEINIQTAWVKHVQHNVC